MPSPIERTVPTSARSAAACSTPSMRSLRIFVISSGRICMDAIRSVVSLSGGARYLSAKSFEATLDARVEHLVADAQYQATDDVRVDLLGGLHLPARCLLYTALDRGYETRVELHGACHLDGKHLVFFAPKFVERPADAECRREPMALSQELEEVEKTLVAAVDDPADRVLLLGRAEARREEERLEVLVLAQRVRPDPELLVDLVELAAIHGGLEQRAGVDLTELFHQLLEALPSGANAEKSTSDSASSIRRFWSSPSSDFRATFSVAMIVRFATSLRISSSARRVSASISRRVRSIASWCCFWAFSFDSASNCSAALRERTRMSSACSRASFSRARYSSSSLSDSSRICCAWSIESWISRARFSSASEIRGNAYFWRISIEAKNAISVQIIRPTPGETRKLPPPFSSAASTNVASASA